MLGRLLRRAARDVFDAIAPERCAACDAIVAGGVLFCHACREAVNALGPPECSRCGAPSVDVGRCAACVRDAGAIRCARAVARYDADDARHPIADALHAFKYAGAWRLAPRLAISMAARAPAALASPVIVPVPLHPARLRARGYNQSALLAWHLGWALRRPVAARLLRRMRDTPSQTALSAAARRDNVAGAFAVRRSGLARGRHVLLVDDVWTSGATARAAAAALHADGATAVDVLTFARVP